MAEIISLQIDAKVGDALAATKSLKTQLKEATTEAQALAAKYGDTSKEAINAAKKTAILKEQLSDFKGTVDALNPEAKFKAIGQVAQGIAGGFSAATGAMAVFGIKSEDTEKALLKVQGALALSEGLNTIMGLGDAFTNLKTVAVNAFNAIKGAIGGTGIGLLVVALGVVVAKWDDIKEAVMGSTSEVEKQIGTVEQLTKATEETNKSLDKQYGFEIKLAKARGQDTSLIEKEKETKKLAAAINNRAQLELKIRQIEEENEKFRKDTFINNVGEEKTRHSLEIANNLNRLDALKTTLKEAKKIEIESHQDLKIILAEQAKAKLDKAAEAEKKEADAVKKVKVKAQESEIDRILREETAKAILMDKAENDFLEVLKQKKQEQIDAEQYYADFIDEIDNNATKSKIQRSKDEIAQDEINRQAKLQIAQSTVEGLAIIGTMFIKDSKKLEKFQKGIALAQIAVDTAKAISSLVAYSNANPLNSVTAGAAGIAQYATGIVSILSNIAKAKQLLTGGSGTTTPSLGGGGGNTNMSTPTASGGANLGGATPNQQSTLLQNANINSSALNQNFVKAVVVETDITDAQNRIQGIQNKSKFG